MPICAHVTHFLNTDGVVYFPLWFNELKEIIQHQPGFIAIKYQLDDVDSTCIKLDVHFQEEALMNKWSCSQSHYEIVAKLNKYRIKPYEVKRLINNKNIEPAYDAP
ncbi:MAG: hypothetical protein ACK4PR_13130 [Gammaproteobacteria bacterium]